MQYPQMFHENLTIFKFEPTISSTSQHVTTGWSKQRNMVLPTMLQYVALTCFDRLARALNSLNVFVEVISPCHIFWPSNTVVYKDQTGELDREADPQIQTQLQDRLRNPEFHCNLRMSKCKVHREHWCHPLPKRSRLTISNRHQRSKRKQHGGFAQELSWASGLLTWKHSLINGLSHPGHLFSRQKLVSSTRE